MFTQPKPPNAFIFSVSLLRKHNFKPYQNSVKQTKNSFKNMTLTVHPSDILFENDDLKKLDPEMFRVEIQTPFFNHTEIGTMNVRVNEKEQSVLLAISNPMLSPIDHQSTMIIKIPMQEVFEMLKRGIRDGKLSRIGIQGRLRLINNNPNALNE